VQEALRSWVSQRDTRPAFARERPADAVAALATAKQRLLGEAQHHYQLGYREGAQIAGWIGWAALDKLAAHKWNLGTWLKELSWFGGYDKVIEHFEDQVSNEGHLPTFETGVVDALRQVWEAVREGGDQDEPAASVRMLPRRRHRLMSLEDE
jgi:hypothetical protein